MDTKIEMKEEDHFSDDISLNNETELFIKNVTIKTINDDVALDDSSGLAVKRGTSFPDFCSEKGREGFSKNVEKLIKSETVTSSNIREIDTKTGTYFQNDREFVTEDLKMNVEKYNSVKDMDSKIEIKEEPWWPETETSFVCNDTKNEEFFPVKSPRLHTEASPSTCSATPYLLSTADLGFAESNIQEILGTDTVETSSVEQTVHYHKKKPAHDYKQSDIFDKGGNNSSKLHACEICSKSFSQWNNLNAHILTHEGKKQFRCDVCEARFTQKEDLKRHILIHQDEIPFKCDICEKSFTEKGNFDRHILIHRGKTSFKCDVCEKCFTEKGSLSRHILIHQGIRPFKCDVCGKCFTEKGNLNKHILIHQGKRPFKCDVCEKRFTQKGSVNKHTLIHQGKRPFKCHVCEKYFTEKGNLSKHILIHQGKSPFKCHVCEKCFTEKRSLNRHILTHQGKRPFKCDKCEKCFTEKRS